MKGMRLITVIGCLLASHSALAATTTGTVMLISYSLTPVLLTDQRPLQAFLWELWILVPNPLLLVN